MSRKLSFFAIVSWDEMSGTLKEKCMETIPIIGFIFGSGREEYKVVYCSRACNIQ